MLTITAKIRSWRAKRHLKKAVSILRNLDDMMRNAGIPRNQRRSVWRSIASSHEDRNKVIDKIASVAGVKKGE